MSNKQGADVAKFGKVLQWEVARVMNNRTTLSCPQMMIKHLDYMRVPLWKSANGPLFTRTTITLVLWVYKDYILSIVGNGAKYSTFFKVLIPFIPFAIQ